MKPRYQVLLCGYYGMGNQGDELLAQSALSLLEEAGVNLEEIAMLSGNPEESQSRFGVRCFHRWKTVEIWQAMRQSRRLLLGGGGLFQDVTSWRSPWYYSGLVVMALSVGCSVLALGQSVGPLQGTISRWLTRRALKSCHAVSVRDEASLDQCRYMSVSACLTPDLVLGLKPRPHRKGPSILVNLRPWKDDLALRAARSIQAWAHEKGASLRGVAMAPEDLGLMQQLNDKGILSLESLDLLEAECPFELFQDVSGAFGMRLHFGVLSLLSHLDCQLVPYDPKISGFVKQWGGAIWNGSVPQLQPWKIEKLPQVRMELIQHFRNSLQEVVKDEQRRES